MSATLTWRHESDDDVPFLRELYASTRVDELEPLGWSRAQLDEFLTMQFDAQRRHYRATYPDADYLVLLLGSRPVGRIYVDRGATALLLIDVALVPDCRGSGLGTALLRDLMEEAARTDRPLRLSVRTTSPALRLYTRLGFRPTDDDGVTLHMEWRRGTPGHASTRDVVSATGQSPHEGNGRG